MRAERGNKVVVMREVLIHPTIIIIIINIKESEEGLRLVSELC